MKKFLEFINENIQNEENIVFKAATRGGKYSMIVTKEKNIHGEYYEKKEYTNDSLSANGSRNTLDEIQFWVADTIYYSNKIDSINYIVELDNIGIEQYLKEITEVEETMATSEFKGWLSYLNEEQIKNMEIEAKDLFKGKEYKHTLIRRQFFVNKFKEFLKKEATK